MGRFRVIADNDGYDGDQEDDRTGSHYGNPYKGWEFTAEKGEEGAIVVHRKRHRPESYGVSRDGDYHPCDDRDGYEGACQEDAGLHSHVDIRGHHFWNEDAPEDLGDDDPQGSSSMISPHRSRYTGSSSFLGAAPYLVLLVAFLSWWIREGPPAPPVLQDGADHLPLASWRSFLGEHSRQWLQASQALFLSTPAHVLKWWIIHMKEDALDIVKYFAGPQTQKPLTTCPRRIADMDFKNLIIGQERAAQVMADALIAWNNSEKRSSQPLLLYLSGFAGTGRSTLARGLYESMHQRDPGHDCRIPTLTYLKGSDFADVSSKDLLIGKILKSEGYIVIESIQEMDKTLFTWLVMTLTDGEENGMAEPTLKDRGTNEDASATLRQHCSQCILVFTSTVGSRSIARSLRHNSDSSSFLLDVGHEIDSFFGGPALSERFDALAPFRPVSRDTLANILLRQVDSYSQEHPERWKSLQLTETSVNYFLGPEYVEYLSWEVKNLPVITFASAGAMVLSDKGLIWNRIRAVIGRCRLESKPDFVAVMSVSASHQEVSLRWCESSLGHIIEPCEEACRLPLSIA